MASGSNGIITEEYTGEQAASMVQVQSIAMEGLRRMKHGYWVLAFKAGMVLELPDGRRLTFQKSMQVMGSQSGRRKRRKETAPRKRSGSGSRSTAGRRSSGEGT
jgi:hypothetical protein